jgi:hypothetical protein
MLVFRVDLYLSGIDIYFDNFLISGTAMDSVKTETENQYHENRYENICSIFKPIFAEGLI